MGKLFLSSFVALGLLMSFVFTIILAILIFLGEINITLAIILTICFNFLMWLIGPTITDFMNKWFYKVEFISSENVQQRFPEIDQVIRQVTKEYGFKYPKIGIIADKNPTAFTYGSGRYNARIVFTEGITHFLDTEEQKAVIAHELGHIVHRDFIIMMIASTLLQILYEIYATLIRAKGKKSGLPKLIAIVSLILYQIGIYIVYYLSRTREYLADSFATKYTSAQALANALIKIAYGIVSVEDSKQTQRLLKSTRQLGIVDVNNAKHTGAISYITNNDPRLIAEVALFDKLNPWAKILQLSSTHPLTGNRLSFLQNLAREKNQTFFYDIDGAVSRASVDTGRLWSTFFMQASIIYSPIIASLVGLIFVPIIYIPAIFGIVSLAVLLYRYPRSQAKTTTILDEMRNVYASPVRGKKVLIQGQIIGRGTPGYVFGEDLMIQDSTGMTFLNYESIIPFLGNFFFALGKVKKLIGQAVQAQGWFFRSYSSQVSLSSLKTNSDTIQSYPFLSKAIGPAIAIGISVVLMFVL